MSPKLRPIFGAIVLALGAWVWSRQCAETTWPRTSPFPWLNEGLEALRR